MSKRKFTEAEIIAALKQGEAGRILIEVAREMGVSKHTVYADASRSGLIFRFQSFLKRMHGLLQAGAAGLPCFFHALGASG
jgi:hypothetical protein